MAVILEWLLNGVIVQISILAFAAPFWLWYRMSRTDSERDAHHSLGEHIELFFSSRQMDWLVFSWAAAEAVVWFIIPEFLLLLIIFMRFRQRIALLAWDLAGTVVGTTIAFAISASAADVVHMPYITAGMVTQVNDWYLNFGAGALAFQPLSGVPYKVFTHLASANHIGLVSLVVVGTLVRMARYVFIYVILSGLYPIFHRFAFRRYTGVFVFSCMVFSLALLNIVDIYGPNYKIQDSRSVIAELLRGW